MILAILASLNVLPQKEVLRLKGILGKQVHLMIGEANVPGEEHGQPVTARRHVHAFGQLLQNGKVTGLEVVRQRDMKLFLVGLDVNIWTEEKEKKHAHQK